MFGAFNTFGKLGSPAGSRSLLAQIQAMGASFIGIPSLSNYQDSAGTLLVTQPGGGAADPPVGKVLDLSGLGNHAIQSTSPARPKLSSRVNLLTYTEQFDNAAWVKSTGASVTLNGDGSYRVTDASAAASSNIYQDLGSKPASRYTYTIEFVKAASGIIAIGISNFWFYFDQQTLSTYVANAYEGTNVVGSATQVNGNRWRLTVSLDHPNPQYIKIYPSLTQFKSDINSSPNPASTGFLDVFTAQFELGSTATRYQRVTDASNYDYSGFPFAHVFDGVDDAHVITFPSSLGSACTVVTANRGTTPTIQTGQTIGTSYTISTTHAGKIIFPRSLTAGETAIVAAWATKQGAIA